MLERCRVVDGGKMFWKFLELGFLKRCNGLLLKFLVRFWFFCFFRGS